MSKTDHLKQRARPGRPVNTQLRNRILKETAALLLARKNLQSITIDDVAARAKTTKATIYKRWESKSTLFVEAFFDGVNHELTFDDKIPVLEALRKQYRTLAAVLAGPHGEVLRGLIAEAQFDLEIRSSLLEGYFRPRRAAAIKFVTDAATAGELRGDVSPEIAVDALYGALFYLLLIRYRSFDDDWANGVVNTILSGLRQPVSP